MSKKSESSNAMLRTFGVVVFVAIVIGLVGMFIVFQGGGMATNSKAAKPPVPTVPNATFSLWNGNTVVYWSFDNHTNPGLTGGFILKDKDSISAPYSVDLVKGGVLSPQTAIQLQAGHYIFTTWAKTNSASNGEMVIELLANNHWVAVKKVVIPANTDWSQYTTGVLTLNTGRYEIVLGNKAGETHFDNVTLSTTDGGGYGGLDVNQLYNQDTSFSL